MTDLSRSMTKVSMVTISRSSLPVHLTQCSICPSPGVARCSVCLAWYCSLACQGLHWPQHRRECVPPPSLLLPDGSPFQEEEGQLELTGMKDVLEAKQAVEGDKKGVGEEKSAKNLREVSKDEKRLLKEQESNTLKLMDQKGDCFESSTVSTNDSPTSLCPPEISDSNANTQLKTSTTSPLKEPSRTSLQEKNKPSFSTAQAKNIQPSKPAVPLKTEPRPNVSTNKVPFTDASTPAHKAQPSLPTSNKTKPPSTPQSQTDKSTVTSKKQSNKPTFTPQPAKPHLLPSPSSISTPSTTITEPIKVPATQKTPPTPSPARHTPQTTRDSTFYPPAVQPSTTITEPIKVPTTKQ